MNAAQTICPVSSVFLILLPRKKKTVELIEPEIVEQLKKSRRKKPALREQFKDIPTRQVPVDTLSAEDKICPLCGREMLSIGTEVIRSEIVYTQPKLERIEHIAATYACPECKATEKPQFIKIMENLR